MNCQKVSDNVEETIEKLKIKNEVLMEMLREAQLKPGSRIELIDPGGQELTCETLLCKFDFDWRNRQSPSAELVKDGLVFLPSTRSWFYLGSRIAGFETVRELETFFKCTQKIPLI